MPTGVPAQSTSQKIVDIKSGVEICVAEWASQYTRLPFSSFDRPRTLIGTVQDLGYSDPTSMTVRLGSSAKIVIASAGERCNAKLIFQRVGQQLGSLQSKLRTLVDRVSCCRASLPDNKNINSDHHPDILSTSRPAHHQSSLSSSSFQTSS